jgi:hypothetical protein
MSEHISRSNYGDSHERERSLSNELLYLSIRQRDYYISAVSLHLQH